MVTLALKCWTMVVEPVTQRGRPAPQLGQDFTILLVTRVFLCPRSQTCYHVCWSLVSLLQASGLILLKLPGIVSAGLSAGLGERWSLAGEPEDPERILSSVCRVF